MTRGKRCAAIKEAVKMSFNGITTYVLMTGDNIIITQDEKEAVSLVHEHGYRVYAKCLNGHLTF